MKKCVFETTGCNNRNIAQIKSAAVTVAGVTAAAIAISGSESYELFVTVRNIRDELLSDLNTAFKPFGVVVSYKLKTTS
jgi:dihydrodipicolinate reductase